MFLKTDLYRDTVNSGSSITSQVIDISGYSKLWIESAISGTIAGTGSVYITSISTADTSPVGVTTTANFNLSQSAIQSFAQNGGSGWTYATSSILPIDAKWAVYKFVETSGSAAGTGSVVVKASLLT